ncbi:MAG TPA: class III extradiol ring-cleavage dioxygenase [Anaeromyxobacteraceae bacterium]|nr:class III extradiol ring-cleavage dioxygenase [Anaeromyxobacteraceae bacterium]
MNSPDTRMPTIYLPHGGGPWPWYDATPLVTQEETRALSNYLAGLPARLPRRPRALVVVSAHWEAPLPTVMTHPHPPIHYDYYGFPPETYHIPWPAPGGPFLATRVRALLEATGLPTAEDARRGFDHGTFVPLKLAFPDADVPTIQLSLQGGLDPARHLTIGRALAPLRDENVLLVGSGMSYHNLQDFRGGPPEALRARSESFAVWLRQVVVSDAEVRDAELTRWAAAPMARVAHPREEHLLPLMVVAGAAGHDRGRVAYDNTFAGVRIVGVHFGG